MRGRCRLEIGVVAGWPGDMLNVALSRLTGLRELTVAVRLLPHHPDHAATPWPPNLRHCTRLRCRPAPPHPAPLPARRPGPACQERTCRSMASFD